MKMCATCGDQPRAVSKNGRVYSHCVGCRRLLHRAWRDAHPGYYSERTKAWNLAHPGRNLERSRAWASNNRERKDDAQQRRRAANKELVNAAKSKPCVDCGQTFPPVAMDLDHVRGSKVRDVSSMVGGRTDLLIEEIAKCDPRCANCHRIKTAAQPPNRGRPRKGRITS